MGRIPTGRPKGRPKGTGRLGESVVRLTVRIPDELYQRFFAFADGRTFHRGDTQLADSVRDALAHYLACPHKRLTRNSTGDRSTDNRQTHNGTVPSVPLELAEPLPPVRHNQPTQIRTESLLEPGNGNPVPLRQTEKSTVLAPPVPTDSPRVSTLGDKAAVLAQLDAWKSAGLNLQKMADHLEAAHVPTLSGKGHWTKGTIGKLLAKRLATTTTEN